MIEKIIGDGIRGFVKKIGCWAALQQLASVNKQHMLGEASSLRTVVACHDDRGAIRMGVLDHLFDGRCRFIIQMRCGFIEKQQARLAGQRADQGQFLLFTTGELMRVRVHLRFEIGMRKPGFSVFVRTAGTDETEMFARSRRTSK